MKLGKHEGSLTKTDDAFLFCFYGAGITLFLTSLDLFKTSQDMLKNLYMFFMFTLGSIPLIGRSLKKSLRKDTIFYISLRILNNFEKDLDDKNIEMKEIEKEERLLKKLDECKPLEPKEESSVLDNIIPAIMEIAATKIGQSLWDRFKKNISRR